MANAVDWPAKIPFIIGATGHRDLKTQDHDSIRQGIYDCLVHWRKSVGENTPIWLLSGMAEGTDLLAIEAAEQAWKDNHWPADSLKIIPCLPLPADALKQDYTEDSYPLFISKLRAYQANQILLPHSLSNEEYQFACNDRDYGALRNSLYLNLGAFIAKYANVVLAVWDPARQSGMGGTSDVVSMKCGCIPDWPENANCANFLRVPDFDGQIGGVVHHININESNTDFSSAPLCHYYEPALPSGPLPEYFQVNQLDKKSLSLTHRLYIAQSEFNDTDAKQVRQHFLTEEFTTLIESMRRYNQPRATNLGQPQAYAETKPLETGLGTGFSLFQFADSTAIRCKATYQRYIILFTLMAMTGFGAYELWPNEIPSILGIALNATIFISIIVCWFMAIRAKKNNLKWHFQISRGIAESLRIKGFLNLAGVPPQPEQILPRRYRKDLPLFNHVMDVADVIRFTSPVKEDIQSVKTHWLVSQITFLKSRLAVDDAHRSFVGKVFTLISKRQWDKRPHLAHEVLSKLSMMLFLLAVALGIVVLILQCVRQVNELREFTAHLPFGTLILFIQFSLMFSGVTALWTELANYEPTANGYRNMLALYQRALFLLQSNPDYPQKEINKLLYSLAKEAIQEHAEWNYFESQSDVQQRTI